MLRAERKRSADTVGRQSYPLLFSYPGDGDEMEYWKQRYMGNVIEWGACPFAASFPPKQISVWDTPLHGHCDAASDRFSVNTGLSFDSDRARAARFGRR